MTQQTNQTEEKVEVKSDYTNNPTSKTLYDKDYTESDLEQLTNKSQHTRTDYLEMLNILDYLKKENVISTYEELKKTEKIFSDAKDLNDDISRIQSTFPKLKNQYQQEFFNQAVKADLNNLDDVLTEFRPLLNDEVTKPYFEGVELVETSFVKNLKSLGIEYTSPSEIKAKLKEEAAKTASANTSVQTSVESNATANANKNEPTVQPEPATQAEVTNQAEANTPVLEKEPVAQESTKPQAEPVDKTTKTNQTENSQ